MKRVTQIVAVLGLAVIVGLVGAFGVIDNALEINWHEITRARNPKLPIDAVVIEGETNATVPTPTHMYLDAEGPASGDILFKADRLSGLKVDWKNEATLTVSAVAARVFEKQTTVKVGSGAEISTINIEYNILNETTH